MTTSRLVHTAGKVPKPNFMKVPHASNSLRYQSIVNIISDNLETFDAVDLVIQKGVHSSKKEMIPALSLKINRYYPHLIDLIGCIVKDIDKER